MKEIVLWYIIGSVVYAGIGVAIYRAVDEETRDRDEPLWFFVAFFWPFLPLSLGVLLHQVLTQRQRRKEQKTRQKEREQWEAEEVLRKEGLA